MTIGITDWPKEAAAAAVDGEGDDGGIESSAIDDIGGERSVNETETLERKKWVAKWSGETGECCVFKIYRKKKREKGRGRKEGVIAFCLFSFRGDFWGCFSNFLHYRENLSF